MEIVRYSLIGKEDLGLGKGTFAARLADGRVVTLSQIDVGALLNDPAISTQTLTLIGLTLTNLTVSGALSLGSVSFTGAFDLTSGQITFPSTQVPSSNVNTLDDYEEGTWTPSVGGTATYLEQYGSYIKIGKLVFLNCNLYINTIGTGSTTIISGVPFLCDRNAALAVSVSEALSTSVVSIGAQVGTSTQSIELYSRTAAAVSNTAVSVMGNSTRLVMTGCYQAQA